MNLGYKINMFQSNKIFSKKYKIYKNDFKNCKLY